MSLGAVPIILIIVGLVIVAAVTSLIAYIVTASRKRNAAGSAPSAADRQLADLKHAQGDAELDDSDQAAKRARTRSQN